jgi:hypothetical protein
MNQVLTDNEKKYLQRLFWDHHEKIDRKLQEELTILSKYKGDLARKYESVGAHHKTLIGCMKDIINKQEELIGMCNHLDDFIARIEKFFLDDVPPNKQIGEKEVNFK